MEEIGDPFALENVTFACGVDTGRYTIFELPPPGGGFTTVMEAVAAVAISAAGTTAVSCLLLTKVVASAAPLKSTVDVGRKPVPFNVRVNRWPPGETALGTSGWLRNGTELPAGVFGVTSMLRKGCRAFAPAPSVSCTQKYQVPPSAGVPLIAPVLAA